MRTAISLVVRRRYSISKSKAAIIIIKNQITTVKVSWGRDN
jgi:hypothetical protein